MSNVGPWNSKPDQQKSARPAETDSQTQPERPKTKLTKTSKIIKKISLKYNVPFHTDGVQVVGRLNINFLKLGIDMMTVSSHKIGGPSGAGALIVASKKQIFDFITKNNS